MQATKQYIKRFFVIYVFSICICVYEIKTGEIQYNTKCCNRTVWARLSDLLLKKGYNENEGV